MAEHQDSIEERPSGAPGRVDDRSRYRELLEEIRTILPGVQVLFAFLLAAPFSPRFPDLQTVDRNLYGVALVATALATTMFMAPASFHRIGASRDRAGRVRTAIVLMIAGMASMAVAIVTAVMAVLRFVYGADLATVVVVGLAAVIATLWYLLPAVTRVVDD